MLLMDTDYLDHLFSAAYKDQRGHPVGAPEKELKTSKPKRNITSSVRYHKDVKTRKAYGENLKKANIYSDFAEVKLLSPRIYDEMNNDADKKTKKISRQLIKEPTKKKNIKTKYKTMPPLGKLSVDERVFHAQKSEGRTPVGFTDFSVEVDNYRKLGVQARSTFSANLKKSLNDAYLFSKQEKLNPTEEEDEGELAIGGDESRFMNSTLPGQSRSGVMSYQSGSQRPQSARPAIDHRDINHNPALNQRLNASKNPGNIPEWTTLRDTYIRQLQNLDSHEETARERGVNSDISIPNFIGLLLAIRKISFKIVDGYKQVMLYREGHHATFSALHAYIIKMATDVNCINRQPFVDWMGITPVYNTFFSERRIDGHTALFAPLDKSPSGIKFQGSSERGPDSCHPPKPDDIFMHRDLQMTLKEQEIVDELGAVVWSAYKNHQDMLRHKATAHSLENLYGLKNEILPDVDDPSAALVGESAISGTEPSHSLYPNHDIVAAASAVDTLNLFYNVRPYKRAPNAPSLKEFWDLWRRTYHVKSGLRNLIDGRHYCVKRKVLVEWMRYAWQSIQFRKMQQRRWMQLSAWTFHAWVQYMFW
jgi:hypothetical protein